jgi:hypothetical protein
MFPCKILKDRGITLNVVGDELRLSPKEKVTPQIVQFAKTHKQEIMAELQSVIWRNPYHQGTKEARIESLMQVMNAIYKGSVKKVREAYESGELIPNPRLEAVRQSVLKGEAKLKDFQAAVDKWAASAELN